MKVDHNEDKVMEWEEFTGFVIDQARALVFLFGCFIG